MPRLHKIGLDYFTLDCNFFHNRKFRLFRAEFDPTLRLSANMIIVLIFARIYEDKGYYIIWNDAEKSLFCEDSGISATLLDDIIVAALKVGIFDAGRFETHGILTSAETLRRYVSATTKRRDRVIDPEMALMTTETRLMLTSIPLTEPLAVPGTQRNVTERNVTELEERARTESIEIDWPKDSIEARTFAAFETEYNNLMPHPHQQFDAINKLFGEARARGDPEVILPSMMDTFRRLKEEDRGKKGFWRKQPFLPSTLVSLWAQVWEEAKQGAATSKESLEQELEQGGVNFDSY